MGGKPHRRGLIPFLSLICYIASDKLVGYEFTSCFADDATDFDEKKVGELRKGASTKKDVLDALGPPTGKHICPMARNGSEEVWKYLYVEAWGSKGPAYRKEAQFIFSSEGTVSDIQYTDTVMN